MANKAQDVSLQIHEQYTIKKQKVKYLFNHLLENIPQYTVCILLRTKITVPLHDVKNIDFYTVLKLGQHLTFCPIYLIKHFMAIV